MTILKNILAIVISLYIGEIENISILIFGKMDIFMFPSPIWFTIVDREFAHITMAYISGKIDLIKSN